MCMRRKRTHSSPDRNSDRKGGDDRKQKLKSGISSSLRTCIGNAETRKLVSLISGASKLNVNCPGNRSEKDKMAASQLEFQRILAGGGVKMAEQEDADFTCPHNWGTDLALVKGLGH